MESPAIGPPPVSARLAQRVRRAPCSIPECVAPRPWARAMARRQSPRETRSGVDVGSAALAEPPYVPVHLNKNSDSECISSNDVCRCFESTSSESPTNSRSAWMVLATVSCAHEACGPKQPYEVRSFRVFNRRTPCSNGASNRTTTWCRLSRSPSGMQTVNFRFRLYSTKWIARRCEGRNFERSKQQAAVHIFCSHYPPKTE